MAKVGTLIKTAKFAGKILGGVATAAGIYEGAKIVGNGVTAGLDALRTRGAQPPPAPPTSSEPVAGEDYAWTGGPDEYWTGAAPVIKKGSRKEVAAIKNLKDEMDSAYQFAKNAVANLEKVKADLAQLQNSPPTSLSALMKLDEYNEKIASLKKLVQIGTDKAQVAKLKYNQAKAKYEAAFKTYFEKYGIQPDFSVVAGAASDAYEEMTSDHTGVGPDEWWTGASDDASAQHAYLVSAREKVSSSWPESREKQEALADLDRQIARHGRTVSGYDSPLVAEARTCVGASSEGAFDEDTVSGSYDCSDAGKAAHMDKILARGFSRPYAAARVDSWRDLVGCNGPQPQEEMRAAIQQLQSEGQSPRQAQSAVVTAATRMRLQGQAPVQGNPVYGHYGVYGADEYWNVGAAPSAIRARGQEPGAAPATSAPKDSKKLRELEDKLTILNFEKTTLERESRDATKAVNTAERDVKEAEKTMGKAPKAYAQTATNTAILLKADKGLKAAKATLEAAKKAAEDKKRALENKTKEIETQKSLITAEKQAIKSKADAEEAKRKGDVAKALAEQKAAITAKQLAKVTEELTKKVADAENAAKQAKTDGEKAVLEAKVAALQEQASNMAKLAAAPKETEKVAQAPNETGLIISSLLQAVLQKNASPQEVAAKVEQGQTPAPTAPMMSFNEMDDLYSIEESDESSEPDALSGGEACCDACRQGLSCSGDSCPVGKAPCAGSGGHEHGHDHDHPHDDVLAGADAIPWATHWASPSAPEWADGIFEGGPGIPSYVSKESCSTGSCRLPK